MGDVDTGGASGSALAWLQTRLHPSQRKYSVVALMTDAAFLVGKLLN